MIKLRDLKLSDKSVLAKLANNKKIWNNVRNHFPFPYSKKDAENFIKFVHNTPSQKVFCIEYQGEFCGLIGLILQDDVYEKSAELGFWIGEPYWNKGITSKAVSIITEFGFNKLNIYRIYSGVFEFNKPSMKVLEKNGYKIEGILKKAVYKNGKNWDEYRFYKLANK